MNTIEKCIKFLNRRKLTKEQPASGLNYMIISLKSRREFLNEKSKSVYTHYIECSQTSSLITSQIETKLKYCIKQAQKGLSTAYAEQEINTLKAVNSTIESSLSLAYNQYEELTYDKLLIDSNIRSLRNLRNNLNNLL